VFCEPSIANLPRSIGRTAEHVVIEIIDDLHYINILNPYFAWDILFWAVTYCLIGPMALINNPATLKNLGQKSQIRVTVTEAILRQYPDVFRCFLPDATGAS
jgi:hypothetical protein